MKPPTRWHFVYGRPSSQWVLYFKHLKLGTKQCYLGHWLLLLSQLRLRSRMEKRECREGSRVLLRGFPASLFNPDWRWGHLHASICFFAPVWFFSRQVHVVLLHSPCDGRYIWFAFFQQPFSGPWPPARGPLGRVLERQSKPVQVHWGCLIQGKLSQLYVMKEWKGSLLHCCHLPALLSPSNPVPVPGKKVAGLTADGEGKSPQPPFLDSPSVFIS